PGTAGPDLSQNGDIDAFVAKVRADGTGLVYAGFIGGSSTDVANAIAVDGSGNAYVAGRTRSDQHSFPVTTGRDLVSNGGTDAFVAKVRADGTSLVYAGYIGGSHDEEAFAIAVDHSGNAYVAGVTNSTENDHFPVKSGPSVTHGGQDDAFVAKVK